METVETEKRLQEDIAKRIKDVHMPQDCHSKLSRVRRAGKSAKNATLESCSPNFVLTSRLVSHAVRKRSIVEVVMVMDAEKL
jgi:hypothetical protein